MKKDRLSVFISLVLRHKPDAAGIRLDRHGWADVDELIEGVCSTGRKIDRAILDEIVRTDGKQRYSFNEDRTKIRANQGHSILVDVGLEQAEPPEYLYHGTADRFVDKVMAEGLKPMSRLYVHLSKDMETAVSVGKRHGNPVVFRVDSGRMSRDGIPFFLSANGIWLTKDVGPEYLEQTGGNEESWTYLSRYIPVDKELKKFIEDGAAKHGVTPVVCAWYQDTNDFYSDWIDGVGYTKEQADELLENGLENTGEFLWLPDGLGLVRFAL